MKLDDKDLRAIMRAKLESGQGNGQNCPGPEVFFGIFAGEIGEEEKLRVVDHVFECPVCLEKFESLRKTFKEMKETGNDLEGISLSQSQAEEMKSSARAKIKEMEEGRSHRGTPVLGRPRAVFLRPRSSMRSLIWTAALLMIVIGASFLFILKNKADNVLRGRADVIIQLIEPKGAVHGSAIEFGWSPVPKAREYVVKLLDDELTIIWTSGKTSETTAAIAPDLLQSLRKGKQYYWKVIIFWDSGRSRESQLQPFIIQGD